MADRASFERVGKMNQGRIGATVRLAACAFLLTVSGCRENVAEVIGQAGPVRDPVEIVDQAGWSRPDGTVVVTFTDFTMDEADRRQAITTKSPNGLLGKGKVVQLELRGGGTGSFDAHSVEDVRVVFWNFEVAPIVADASGSDLPLALDASPGDGGWATGQFRGEMPVEGLPYLWNLGFKVAF